MVAVGEHILDLIEAGRVASLAFVLILNPEPGGKTRYEADLVGNIATDRLLASGVCDELKELVRK